MNFSKMILMVLALASGAPNTEIFFPPRLKIFPIFRS